MISSTLADWIIGTGATNHVTGEKPWLFDVMEAIDCLIGLPNGPLVVATHKGPIRIFEHFTLTNVLFAPKVSCNL